jgi:dTDP-4-amino-4,6-dideoxygalactose transaminase
MEVLHVMRPRLPRADAVAPYLERMDEARMYANFGPLVQELERRYAERFRLPPEQVVSCSSATMGIQGAVEGLGAARVHCPAWTFPATPLAILNSGAGLAFRDVRAQDWQVDAEGPERDGDAIVPVLPFGAEIDLARWSGWERCVIDAAASGGAADRDLSRLPESWAVVVSLHATKVLGIGEGGIVAFGSAEAADRFRRFTSFGFDAHRASVIHGSNAKMPEASAAYGLAALDLWEQEAEEWDAARALVRAAEHRLGLSTPCSAYPGVNPYWIVRLPDAATRDRAQAALLEAGVESRQWWQGRCDLMPAFAAASVADPDLAQATALAETVVGLPFFRGMTALDVDRVCAALAPVLAERR